MANITKLALEAALKKELLTKPLDKITINDLAEDCGISRMAFYYGFSQLSTSEFLKREMEMHETKNHLLCGWCNKCL